MGSQSWKFLTKPIVNCETMFVIVPAKPFDQSKNRLSPVLSPRERIDLSRHLFKRTLNIAGQIGEVVVVSRDPIARKLAKRAGAWALVEAGSRLNSALRQACEWAILQGAEAICVVPSDLPRLTVADLAELIDIGQTAPAVVIAPCHHQEGTNALLMRPPGLIDFAFGPDSFARHRQAARAAGIEPIIHHALGIALDLDSPDDLTLLKDIRFLAG